MLFGGLERGFPEPVNSQKPHPLTPFPSREGGTIKASLLIGERYPAGSRSVSEREASYGEGFSSPSREGGTIKASLLIGERLGEGFSRTLQQSEISFSLNQVLRQVKALD